MKRILVLVLLMLAQVGLAQKTRAVQLDADTTTRPSVGMYGIGVRAGNAYLVPRTGNNFYLGGKNAIYVDTLNGRYIFKMPSHLPRMIPDDHHISTEPDFVKVWMVNTLNDTLKEGYTLHHITYDNAVLRLLEPSKANYYHLTVFCADTLNKLFSADSVCNIYFPDTICVSSGGNIFKSNYMSSEHPSSYFKLEPRTHFQLVYIDDKKKYFLTRKEWNEFNY